MNVCFNFFKTIYQYFIYLCLALQHVFLLLIRLYWGFLFFQAGYGKFQNMDHVIQFFQSLGIVYPEFNAYLVAIFETVCGILLIIGFAGRLAAIPLIVIMITAYLTAHQEQFMSFFNDYTLFFSSPNFPFFMTALLVFLFGAGFFSIDGIIKGVLKKNKRPLPPALSNKKS